VSFILFGLEEEALTIRGEKQRRSSLYKSRRHHNITGGQGDFGGAAKI